MLWVESPGLVPDIFSAAFIGHVSPIDLIGLAQYTAAAEGYFPENWNRSDEVIFNEGFHETTNNRMELCACICDKTPLNFPLQARYLLAITLRSSARFSL